jgi:hypothetical protein
MTSFSSANKAPSYALFEPPPTTNALPSIQTYKFNLAWLYAISISITEVYHDSLFLLSTLWFGPHIEI